MFCSSKNVGKNGLRSDHEFEPVYDSLYKLNYEPLDVKDTKRQKNLKLMDDWKEQIIAKQDRNKINNHLTSKIVWDDRKSISKSHHSISCISQHSSILNNKDQDEIKNSEPPIHKIENGDKDVYNTYDDSPCSSKKHQNSNYLRNSAIESLKTQRSFTDSQFNDFEEPAFADIIRSRYNTKNNQNNNFVVERGNSHLDYCDWGKESPHHITAKKMKLNKTENYKSHINFLQKQIETDDHHFKYKKSKWEDDKLNQYKPHKCLNNENSQSHRNDIYQTARNEYLHNRVRLGLFADKELDKDGQINFTRFDRIKQKDNTRNNIFGNPYNQPEQTENTNCHHKTNDREIYSNYQNFMKKDYDRDEEGRILYNKDFISRLGKPMPEREISNMYPISSDNLFKRNVIRRKNV